MDHSVRVDVDVNVDDRRQLWMLLTNSKANSTTPAYKEKAGGRYKFKNEGNGDGNT